MDSVSNSKDRTSNRASEQPELSKSPPPSASASAVAGQNEKTCEECRAKTALYVCPRCRFRSCSLWCCLAHKGRLGCSGKRDRTSFLPVGRMTDATLQSDYHFLEDVLTQVDSGRRLLRQVGAAAVASSRDSHRQSSGSNKRFRRGEQREGEDSAQQQQLQHTMLRIASSSPAGVTAVADGVLAGNNSNTNISSERNDLVPSHPKLRKFQQSASDRGVRVVFMPHGMERHKNNRSHVKKPSNVIFWTVEWRVHHCDRSSAAARASGTAESSGKTNSGIGCRGDGRSSCRSLNIEISEEASLRETLSSKVLPKVAFAPEEPGRGDYRLLMKRLPCRGDRPSFVELCDEATLGTSLRDMTVVEYPTIEVVPVSRLADFPVSIQELPSEPVAATSTSRNEQPHQPPNSNATEK